MVSPRCVGLMQLENCSDKVIEEYVTANKKAGIFDISGIDETHFLGAKNTH